MVHGTDKEFRSGGADEKGIGGEDKDSLLFKPRGRDLDG
jgi:hypothetical protein